eukprot:12159876-Karenia_brevis.AAC.1
MSRHAHKCRLLDLISMVADCLFTIDTGHQFTCGGRMYGRAHGTHADLLQLLPIRPALKLLQMFLMHTHARCRALHPITK